MEGSPSDGRLGKEILRRLRNVLHQMRRSFEIPIRGADVGVPHVGGKREDVLANLVATSGAGFQSPHGERMTDVMNSGAVST